MIFKNANNRYLTKNLFYDLCLDSDSEYCVYTTQEEDRFIEGKRYLSVYRLFLEANDPTGYEFAKKHLGSWYHFELLMKTPWFSGIINKARIELEIKTKSQALLSIIKDSKDQNSKSKFQAAKYLLDKKWTEDNNPVGRPTKDRIKEEAEKLFHQQDLVDEDYDRLTN